MNMTSQIVKGIPDNKLLISTRRTVRAGNMVCHGATKEALRQAYEDWDKYQMPHFIKNKKSRIQSKLYEKDGVYKYSFWQKKRINHKKKQDNRMEVDSCGVCDPAGEAGSKGSKYWDLF